MGVRQSLPPCLQPQGQALYGVEQGEGAHQKSGAIITSIGEIYGLARTSHHGIE